jgi:hypothetical protein
LALPLSSDDIKSGHTDAKIVRTGKSQLEQRALQRFRIEVASVPASTIVQLCMWPETLADWARRVPISPSVVFNALAGRRI